MLKKVDGRPQKKKPVEFTGFISEIEERLFDPSGLFLFDHISGAETKAAEDKEH
jgi:hypothetical protein